MARYTLWWVYETLYVSGTYYCKTRNVGGCYIWRFWKYHNLQRFNVRYYWKKLVGVPHIFSVVTTNFAKCINSPISPNNSSPIIYRFPVCLQPDIRIIGYSGKIHFVMSVWDFLCLKPDKQVYRGIIHIYVRVMVMEKIKTYMRFGKSQTIVIPVV